LLVFLNAVLKLPSILSDLARNTAFQEKMRSREEILIGRSGLIMVISSGNISKK
jgi:hypothetical protein